MNVSLFRFPRNIKLLMQEFNLKLDKGFMLSVLDFFKQEEILKEVMLEFLQLHHNKSCKENYY